MRPIMTIPLSLVLTTRDKLTFFLRLEGVRLPPWSRPSIAVQHVRRLLGALNEEKWSFTTRVFLSAWSLYSWDRSVPPSLENIKLVFNLQVSKPTDLFTVVLLVFLLSDVFELLVFRPPPCSSCERSEPTWQLFWSSLYNAWGCWLLTLYSSSLDCC